MRRKTILTTPFRPRTFVTWIPLVVAVEPQIRAAGLVPALPGSAAPESDEPGASPGPVLTEPSGATLPVGDPPDRLPDGEGNGAGTDGDVGPGTPGTEIVGVGAGKVGVGVGSVGAGGGSVGVGAGTVGVGVGSVGVGVGSVGGVAVGVGNGNVVTVGTSSAAADPV